MVDFRQRGRAPASPEEKDSDCNEEQVMITVKDLLRKKGAQVYSTSPDAAVFEALRLMADKAVGALVVLEGDTLVGLISERDYARKVILKGKASKETLVREIMTQDIICISLSQTAEGCMALMTDNMIRHMPVLDEGRLVGIISIGDVVESVISSHQASQTVINELLKYSLEDMKPDKLLQHALDLILSVPWLAFEKQGSIFVVDDTGELVMKAQAGLPNAIKHSCARLPFGKCLCGRAATTQMIQFADCVDDRHEICHDDMAPHGHYCVPICYGGGTLGVINIYIREGHRHAAREEQFLIAVANTLAGIIMRQRLSEELVKSERLSAIGQTVAGLAHCIKGILFGLEGAVYIVNKALKKNDMAKMHKGWNMVRKNIDKTSSLVIDLLDYSKPRTPELESSSPNLIAEEVCELLEPRIRDGVSANIKIHRSFEPEIGMVLIDPKGIHRCLLNLVSNAIDACLADEDVGKNFIVEVTTRRDGEDHLIFQVSDNGCGMDEVVMQHMFTSFFSTKGSKGTGLGLLITQKIVQEHGGILTATSVPGKGSVLTIQLPFKHG
jgi:signal transduction histidine kinase/CBS domain-containing protein